MTTSSFEIAARHVTIYPKIATGFSTEVNAAVAKGTSQSGKVVGDGLEKGVQQAAPKMGATFKSIAAPILTLSAVGVVTDFVGKSVSAFNEFQDASSAAAVTFGASMGKVEAVTSRAAKTMGISKTEATNAAITYGTFAKAAGLAGDDAANFSTKMVQLAADMASFRGTSPDQAIEAIGAAMRGENDPLEQFGVLLNDATVKARALSMGIIHTTKDALTPQQRVLAVQQELLAQTTQMQGDYNRTADQGGNVQKTLAAESSDLAVEIGEKLQPAIVEAQKAGIGMVDWAIQNQAVLLPLAKTVGIVGAAIGGFVAVSKGIDAVKSARETISGLGVAFQQLGTKARVAGAGVAAGAGVIGVALGAAAVVYGLFAEKNIKAQAASEAFTAALEASNGVIDESVKKSAFKELQDRGAIAAANQMGLSLTDLTDSVLGNADAYDRVQMAMQAWWPDAERASAWGWDPRWGNLQTINEALGHMGDEFSGTQAALEDLNSATGAAVTSTGKIATAAVGGKISFQEYTKAINENYNAQLKLRSDERAVEAAIDDAADSMKAYRDELVKKYEKQGKSKSVAEEMAAADIKAGKALDINTAAGRKNQDALDGIASSALSAVAGMSDADKASGKAGKTMDRARDSFIRAAEKMGLGSEAAKKLADRLGLIKSKKVSVEVSAKMNPSADQIVYSVSGHGQMKFTARALGGPITGGIPGRDSVLSLLTPDEHVLTTSDVKALGGHEGVFRMRALAQKGVLRFASGGPVAPTYKGHTLDYWQDYLLSDLEFTQLQIRIRDLQSELKATETYNPPGKRKRAKRQKLRGLDRKEAQLELKDAQEKLQLAKDAAAANSSKEGTIKDRLSEFEQQQEKAQDAASIWQSAASSLAKSAGLGSLDAVSVQHTNAMGEKWTTNREVTAADLAARVTEQANQVSTFIDLLDQLRKAGASDALISDVMALGTVDGTKAARMYLADRKSMAAAESAYAQLASSQARLNSIGDAAGNAAVQVTINEAATPEATAQAVVNKILIART